MAFRLQTIDQETRLAIVRGWMGCLQWFGVQRTEKVLTVLLSVLFDVHGKLARIRIETGL